MSSGGLHGRGTNKAIGLCCNLTVLYGFPLYSLFAFSGIGGVMSGKSRQHCCVKCLKHYYRSVFA